MRKMTEISFEAFVSVTFSFATLFVLSSPMFLQLRFPSRLSAAPSSTTTAQKPPSPSTLHTSLFHDIPPPPPLSPSSPRFKKSFRRFFFSVRTSSGRAKIRTPFASSSLPHSSWEAKGALQLFFLFFGGRGRDFSLTPCLLFLKKSGNSSFGMEMFSSYVIQYVWCIVM